MTANRPRPRELYRDPARGRVAGVCAGLADYFGWPVWPVRLGIALLAIFTQFFPVVAAYLIAWFILDPVSPNYASGLRGQMDDWVMKTRSRWDRDQGRPITPPTAEPAPDTASGYQQTSGQPSPFQAPTRDAETGAGNGQPMFDQPPFRSANPDRNRPTGPAGWLAADAVAIEACLLELESRVRDIERHVTEPAFVLRQQFRSL